MKLAPIAHQRLIKILSFAGYFPVRQKGSHIILENPLTKKSNNSPCKDKKRGHRPAIGDSQGGGNFARAVFRAS